MAIERCNSKEANMDMVSLKKKGFRPVLVTTEYRGVFYGWANDTNGDTITLTNARNCIYWPSTQGGFGGLASEGPVRGSRIGARIEKMELRKITAVAECTAAAVEAWEAANVYRG